MKQKKTIVGIIIILMLAVFVIGFFVYLNNKDKPSSQEETQVSAVSTILLRDLSKNYPPTPKEVLKFYSEITSCFYNEEFTEEELIKLADKARQLYDRELVDDMTQEEYVESLKDDILNFQAQKIVVSGYSVSASTDVEYFKEDGFEWARLYATYRLRQGTQYVYSNEVFLLRKDDDGHWKIFSWDLADAVENADSMEEVSLLLE